MVLKKRICLWSSPRNISTALMYSFAQRSDTQVVDEPLYGHYLRVTGADHPGRDEIISSMISDGEKVISDLILGGFESDILFMKQMTHHLVDIDRSFLSEVENVLLIRDPKRIISSYNQVMPSVNMNDIGVRMQYELFNELNERGIGVTVIDSGEILRDPGKALQILCETVGIGFQKEMLSWNAGPRPEDGIWAKHWYANVHQSTGFAGGEINSREVPDNLKELYRECLEYYRELFNHSIRV
ncbi:MAG: sulfotransferase family protein [Ignavibacteria bacterium]|nr:sulfotransferase family protein [Ignavibacteria bacterium]